MLCRSLFVREDELVGALSFTVGDKVIGAVSYDSVFADGVVKESVVYIRYDQSGS